MSIDSFWLVCIEKSALSNLRLHKYWFLWAVHRRGVSVFAFFWNKTCGVSLILLPPLQPWHLHKARQHWPFRDMLMEGCATCCRTCKVCIPCKACDVSRFLQISHQIKSLKLSARFGPVSRVMMLTPVIGCVVIASISVTQIGRRGRTRAGFIDLGGNSGSFASTFIAHQAHCRQLERVRSVHHSLNGSKDGNGINVSDERNWTDRAAESHMSLQKWLAFEVQRDDGQFKKFEITKPDLH